MVADVYAGDTDAASNAAATLPVAFRYTVIADAAPDVLVRVSMTLALGSQCPLAVTLTRPEPDIACIDATLPDIVPQSADYIRRKLLQITDVREVDCAPLTNVASR